jgi:hypothetical protein
MPTGRTIAQGQAMTTTSTLHDRPADPPSEAGEKPTAELAGDFARQITELIHSEIQLAKAEVGEKGRRFGFGAGGFGAVAVLGLAGLGCLVTAAIAAVHLELVLWLSALVVAGGCFLIAGIAALAALRQVKKATPPVPTEAIASTKEDVQWVKTQAKSATR